MKPKNILCLASGGFDSTYMMIKYLEEGHNVFAVYFKTLINDSQKKAELGACKEIFYFLKKRFDNFKDWVYFDFSWQSLNNCSLSMPPMFVSAAFMAAQSSYSTIYDEVALGYIMNDDALSYIQDMKTCWNSYKPFLLKKETFPKIVFPLTKVNKEHTMFSIADKYEELFEKISFCENPYESGERCRKCPSCKKAESHEYELCRSHSKRNSKSYSENENQMKSKQLLFPFVWDHTEDKIKRVL